MPGTANSPSQAFSTDRNVAVQGGAASASVMLLAGTTDKVLLAGTTDKIKLSGE